MTKKSRNKRVEIRYMLRIARNIRHHGGVISYTIDEIRKYAEGRKSTYELLNEVIKYNKDVKDSYDGEKFDKFISDEFCQWEETK